MRVRERVIYAGVNSPWRYRAITDDGLVSAVGQTERQARRRLRRLVRKLDR